MEFLVNRFYIFLSRSQTFFNSSQTVFFLKVFQSLSLSTFSLIFCPGVDLINFREMFFFLFVCLLASLLWIGSSVSLKSEENGQVEHKRRNAMPTKKKNPLSAGEQNLKLVKHSSNGKQNLAKIREDLRECISPFIWYMSYLPHQKWSLRKRGCQ